MRASAVRLAWLGTAVLAALGGAIYLAGQVLVPKADLLGKSSGGRLDALLLCPRGQNFSLVLGVDKNSAMPSTTKLELAHQNRLLACLLVEEKNAIWCNWLRRFGLDGFVYRVAESNVVVNLDHILREGSEYQVSVTHTGPQSTSLWLCYLQRISDRCSTPRRTEGNGR